MTPPLAPLVSLLERAIKARDSSGAPSMAERLILFTRVVNVLEQFVTQETRRLDSVQKVRRLARALSALLRDMEGHTPPHEHTVRDYYIALTELQVALTELQSATRVITIFDDGLQL